MESIKVKIEDVKLNDDNPRTIKEVKFKQLVKSIKEFPEMLDIRPIVVDENNIVLGGNMRLRACIHAGLKEVSIVQVTGLTAEQKREFIVKDNVGFGEWDWDILANEWDVEKLVEWGLDLPAFQSDEETYTTTVESPIYECKESKPNFKQLFNLKKYEELIKEIEGSEIGDEDKEFLRYAAMRHIVFDYRKIAEYYAHSDKGVQELMENSALVIIDYDKAIEKGFVELHKTLSHLKEIDG